MALFAPRLRRDPRLQNAAENRPPLKRGDTGDAVITVQQALIDLGSNLSRSAQRSRVPDGVFGHETEAAVRAFQSANGLLVDGVVGRQTLGTLDKIFLAMERAARNKQAAEIHLSPPVGKWYVS